MTYFYREKCQWAYKHCFNPVKACLHVSLKLHSEQHGELLDFACLLQMQFMNDDDKKIMMMK